MPIFAVSRVVDNDRNATAMGLVDSSTRQFSISTIDRIKKVLSQGLATIENIEIVGGELKGTMGDIDRLPMVDQQNKPLSSPMVTIVNAISDGANTVEYDIVDYTGALATIDAATLIAYAKEVGISNAKVVERDGKEYISAIKGSFNTVVKPKPTVSDAYYQSKIAEAYNAVRETAFERGFDKVNLKLFREEFNKAMKGLKSKYGIDLVLNSITYSNFRFTARLEGVITGKEKTGDQVIFEKYCSKYGFEPTDYGREFLHDGKVYVISGLNLRAGKFAITGTDKETGKEYRFTVDYVKQNMVN